jgi:hypothetical protein
LSKESSQQTLDVLFPFENDPDAFVSVMNLCRELCFNETNFRVASDPVGSILELYLGDKECLEALASVPSDEPDTKDSEPDTAYRQGLTRVADMTRMLASDSTEPRTPQGVSDRVEAAEAHLAGRKTARLLAFLHRPSVQEEYAPEMFGDVETLNRMTASALVGYSKLFAETMVSAFKNIRDVDNTTLQEEQVATGIRRFGNKVSDIVAPRSWNVGELPVFVEALSADAGDSLTAMEKLLVVSQQKSPTSQKFFTDAVSAMREVFVLESAGQTNFNSANDFVDFQPEIKEYRDRVFNTIRRRAN